MSMGREVKGLIKGRKVAIDYRKSRIYVVNKMTPDGDFFTIYSHGLTIKVRKEWVVLITKYAESQTVKIAINYPYATLGEIVNVEDKFITLKIFHKSKGQFYYNVIPIKQILGIKVYDEKFDPYIDENDEDEVHSK